VVETPRSTALVPRIKEATANQRSSALGSERKNLGSIWAEGARRPGTRARPAREQQGPQKFAQGRGFLWRSLRHAAEHPLHQEQSIRGAQGVAVKRWHRAVAEFVADLRSPTHDVLEGVEGPWAGRIGWVVTRRARLVENWSNICVGRRRIGTLCRRRYGAALFAANAITRPAPRATQEKDRERWEAPNVQVHGALCLADLS